MSDLDWELLQRFRFWIDGEHNPSDFLLALLQRVSFRIYLFCDARFRYKEIQRVRLWDRSFTTRQILNWKNFIWSQFDLRLWINNSATWQILYWKKRTHQVLHINFFYMSVFKKTCIQKITFCSFSPWKQQFLLFSSFSKKNGFHSIFYNLSVIERRIQLVGFRKKRVRFCVKSFTTRRIWKWRKFYRVRFWKKNSALHSELKFSDMSDFEYKKIQRVRFWI